MNPFALFPERASEAAGRVDSLYTFLLVVAVSMTVLIFGALILFAIKYRRKDENAPMPPANHGSIPLEVAWSVIPFLIMLVMFTWGTKLYFDNFTPPPEGTLDIYITGKQWMWKVQYPTGQGEINELHVPVGQPVKLIMASEDVIHSFFIPAFRMKHDVVPGSYQTYWFQATKPGRYRILCAEYCGTNHSEMGGWVTVMTSADFNTWLGNGSEVSMRQQGQQLFERHGCVTCHVTDRAGRCPSLQNVFGNPVVLEDGRTVLADTAYVRESILNPNAKIVKGYPRDVMPSFMGQIDEQGLLQLIVYIKSLSAAAPQPPVGSPAKRETK